MNFAQAALDISEDILSLQRRLHRTPETGLLLPETAGILLEALAPLGLEIQTYPGHSAIAATLSGGLPGRTVALRADMDGLPIREETGLPYASTNGCMHACGHDGHAAMLVGAARLLHDQRGSLPGTVKFLFQPAEESVGGARPMIQDGVLDNPRVDGIFGLHCGNLAPGLPAGHFASRAGGMMASCDRFTLTITGKGCHGATPAAGIDPVVVAAQIILAFQTLVSRECNGTDCAVLTIGSIHSGDAFNVIPDQAVLKGSLRCLDEGIRARLCRRIPSMAAGIAQAMGAESRCEFDTGCPVTVNHPAMTELALSSARKLFGAEAACLLEPAVMVSEDMSLFLQEVPGCFCFFSTPPQQGPCYPHHSARFSIDSTLLWRGSAMLAQCAWDFLTGPTDS